MFPPVQTDDPSVWLQGLWSSLTRAGEHLLEDGRIEEDSDGTVVVVFFLKSRLPKGATGYIKSYIKAYSRECGWEVQGYKTTSRQLILRASRAASNLSRKR